MRLAQQLQKHGHKVVVFAPGEVSVNPEAPEIPVRGVMGASPMHIAARLAAAVFETHVDHVILQYTAQMWRGSRLGNPAAEWFARAMVHRGIPVSLFVHELYTRLEVRPDLLLGALAFRVQLAAVMKACTNVFLTTESRVRDIEWLWQSAGLRGEPHLVRIAPNAIPVPRRAQSGKARIGVFSTLATTKRFDIVLDAFDAIREEMPNATLSILGDIGSLDDRRVTWIHDRIAKGIEEGWGELPGKQPLGEIAERLADLDVYLFPMTTGANTRSGTLPLALGAGLPVVAIRGSETDSLFVDRENIVLASEMSGPAYAEAALRILRDQALFGRVSAGARRLYEEHLSWNATYATLSPYL